MYNAVLLYYTAIIRTIKKKESITDGKTVMNNAKVMSFPNKHNTHHCVFGVILVRIFPHSD